MEWLSLEYTVQFIDANPLTIAEEWYQKNN